MEDSMVGMGSPGPFPTSPGFPQPPAPNLVPEPLKTSLDHPPQTPLGPKLPITYSLSHPGPPISRLSLPALPHPCPWLWGERSLTFRDRQDNLAEGPAPQLVLSQDAELVLGVGLQPWHKDVSGPHGHRQGHPIVMGPVRTLGPGGHEEMGIPHELERLGKD